MTILDDIIAYKKIEVQNAKHTAPLSALEALAKSAGPVRGFHDALSRKAESGFALIAEIKKASPSKGLIREQFMPEEHARDYQAGGAACLSVLTDGPSFQGNGKYLRVARAACDLPVLRKDFMIDSYQCVEARAWGADCILIIMACVSDQLAAELTASAHSLGMDVLIEVHNEAELERAVALPIKLIGVNNRNLKNFETDLNITTRLAAMLPKDRFLIAESGIRDHQDLQRLADDGARGFLVGESLMRHPNVEEATRALLRPSVQYC